MTKTDIIPLAECIQNACLWDINERGIDPKRDMKWNQIKELIRCALRDNSIPFKEESEEEFLLDFDVWKLSDKEVHGLAIDISRILIKAPYQETVIQYICKSLNMLLWRARVVELRKTVSPKVVNYYD